ncbi:MAG: alpha/beta hydrolase-fold protein [Planctomycetaceae bacterium]
MYKLLAFCFTLCFLTTFSVSHAEEPYKLGPDSQRQAGVPQGEILEGSYTNKNVYPGTVRDYFIYIPAQYQPGEEACLMVFQDGHEYVDVEGDQRVPVVFDNLIHQQKMPITIGVFIKPGVYPAEKEGAKPKSNRSVEYDSLGDEYARFLLDEFLPMVEEKYDVKFTNDPEGRAIGGLSSGGICAWTVAWERPDSFRKVLSHVGSYVDIRGGHNYPPLIRKTEPKPIRIFMQDGENDLDNIFGNWPLANQQMALALKYKEYDYKFEYGVGRHSHKHGGAILPESLVWLWRDYQAKE